MSKNIAYSVVTGRILQWQDTESFHYAPPPDSVELLAVTDDEWDNQASFGWVQNGDLTHIAPVLETPVMGKEEARMVSLARRDALLAEATAVMAPLQDAVDIKDVTAKEQNALTAWKRYRVALNRIEDQPGFPMDIDWPAAPVNDFRPEHQNSR